MAALDIALEKYKEAPAATHYVDLSAFPERTEIPLQTAASKANQTKLGYLEEGTVVKVVRELVNADWHAVFVIDPDIPAFKKATKAYYVRSEYLSALPHINLVPKQFIKPQKLSSLTKSSMQDWTKRNPAKPFYHQEDTEYWITVKLPISCTGTIDEFTSYKESAKYQALTQLFDYYDREKFDSLGNNNVQKLSEGFLTCWVADYHLDSRPGSSLKMLVKIDAGYFESVPQKPIQYTILNENTGARCPTELFKASQVVSLLPGSPGGGLPSMEPLERFEREIDLFASQLQKWGVDMYRDGIQMPNVDLNYEASELRKVPGQIRQLLMDNGHYRPDLPPEERYKSIDIGMDDQFNVLFVFANYNNDPKNPGAVPMKIGLNALVQMDDDTGIASSTTGGYVYNKKQWEENNQKGKAGIKLGGSAAEQQDYWKEWASLRSPQPPFYGTDPSFKWTDDDGKTHYGPFNTDPLPAQKLSDIDWGSYCGLGAFPWPNFNDFFGAGGKFDAGLTGAFNYDFGALAFRFFTIGPPCPLPPVGVGPPPYKNDLGKWAEDAWFNDGKNLKKMFKDTATGMRHIGDYYGTPAFLSDVSLEIPSLLTLDALLDIIMGRISVSQLLAWVCHCFADIELFEAPIPEIDFEVGGGGQMQASAGVSGKAQVGGIQPPPSPQTGVGMTGPAGISDIPPGAVAKNTSAKVTKITPGNPTVLTAPNHGLGSYPTFDPISGKEQTAYPVEGVSVVMNGFLGFTSGDGFFNFDNDLNGAHAVKIVDANTIEVSVDTAGAKMGYQLGSITLTSHFTSGAQTTKSPPYIKGYSAPEGEANKGGGVLWGGSESDGSYGNLFGEFDTYEKDEDGNFKPGQVEKGGQPIGYGPNQQQNKKPVGQLKSLLAGGINIEEKCKGGKWEQNGYQSEQACIDTLKNVYGSMTEEEIYKEFWKDISEDEFGSYWDIQWDPNTGQWEDFPLFYQPTETTKAYYENKCENLPKTNNFEILEYNKCKEDAKAHLEAIAGYQQAMGNYPTTEDGVPIMQNENGEWVPVYDAFFGNLQWGEAQAAEAAYTAKTEGTVPVFGPYGGPPISYSAEFQATAAASMENTAYMKGGVGVKMQKFTVKDICEFCLNWPSFDFRFPSFDLMLNLVLLLELFLELLLVQLLIALLIALLNWLLQCPQFSCPEEEPSQQQTPDYGAVDIKEALENSIKDNLALASPASMAAPAESVYKDCGMPVATSTATAGAAPDAPAPMGAPGGEDPNKPGQMPSVADAAKSKTGDPNFGPAGPNPEHYTMSGELPGNFLSSVSQRLTTAEVVATVYGAPSNTTIEVMKDTLKQEYPELLPHLGTTMQLNNFSKCVGKHISNDEIRKMNETLEKRMVDPTFCAKPLPTKRELMEEKCDNPLFVDKFLNRELNFNRNQFQQIADALRNPDFMDELIPPILSKPARPSQFGEPATPAQKGLLEDLPGVDDVKGLANSAADTVFDQVKDLLDEESTNWKSTVQLPRFNVSRAKLIKSFSSAFKTKRWA